MTVSISNVSLPAAASLIAVASDGTQLWQAMLPGFDNSGTLANDSILKPHPVQNVPRLIVVAASAMTRAANVTAYTALDAVSNNATVGSVTPISLTVSDLNDAPVSLERIRIDATDTGVQGQSFRVWLFRSDPTASSGVVGGDNTAFSNKKAGYIGAMTGTFKTFSDGSFAICSSEDGSRILTLPTSGAATVFALLQTLNNFTPSANSTTFTLTAEALQGRA